MTKFEVKMKEAIKQARLNESKCLPKLSVANGKLKKDGIASFGLPALFTCPGASTCKSYCYATRGSYHYDNVVKSRAINFIASQRSDFVELFCDALLDLPRRVNIIRLHDSGDFYSQRYVDNIVEIARRNPSIKFYAYTKSLCFDFSAFVALVNCKIVVSSETKFADKIDSTHQTATVFKNVDSFDDSFDNASYSDLITVNSDKHIALVLH